jgi:NAD(P)-dependent dehydrogenase (short-subunit alcohol dehydrogenase family)
MSKWKHRIPRAVYLSGGGSGIGLGIATALIAEGCSIAIFDLQMPDETLARLQQACNVKRQSVRFYAADVTDPQAMDLAMADARTQQGVADLAFNCAGMMRNAVFTELPYETFERVIRVNLLGSRNFAASALKHLATQGHLVFMASLAGIVGSYTQSAYAASKFGVVGLAEVLRAEQKLSGIDVSVVCPGEIQTPLLDYERQHGSDVTRELNSVAGVLTVDEAVAGILRGIQRRQFMITPGFKAKVIRAIARKCSSLQRWIVDRNLAKSFRSKPARASLR